MSKKSIIVLVGPSGSGKTALAELLKKDGVKKLTTSTTRQKRIGESHGRDYYFVDEESFKFDSDSYVEYSEYSGNYYGLSKDEVASKLGKYKNVTIVMDENGAKAIQSLYPKETIVVQLLISEDDLISRLRLRGDDERTIEKRLIHARENKEFEKMKDCTLSLLNKTPIQARDEVKQYIQ